MKNKDLRGILRIKEQGFAILSQDRKMRNRECLGTIRTHLETFKHHLYLNLEEIKIFMNHKKMNVIQSGIFICLCSQKNHNVSYNQI